MGPLANRLGADSVQMGVEKDSRTRAAADDSYNRAEIIAFAVVEAQANQFFLCSTDNSLLSTGRAWDPDQIPTEFNELITVNLYHRSASPAFSS